jgi:outer membrane protein assembly factor BamB
MSGLALMLLAAAGAFGDDWAQWRGPTRDGVSAEKGWSSSWPKGGPKVLWKARVGTGASSLAIAGGRVFTMGNTGLSDKENKNEDTVWCLNADTGEVIWKYSYPQPCEPSGFEGGPCVAPCVDGNFVYTQNKRGRVWCFEAATGKVVWDSDPEQQVGKGVIWGGVASSPLVEGNLLIAGSRAFDKTTGKVVWTAKNGCTWASPLPFMQAGKRHIAFFSQRGLAAVNPADGTEVWFFPWPSDQNVADPVFWNDKVFLSSRRLKTADEQCALLQPGEAEGQVAWKNGNLMSYFHVRVLWQDHVYGCDEQGLTCLDLKTGDVKWSQKGLARGQLIVSDGRLLVMVAGTLVVAEATPLGYKELARAAVVNGQTSVAPVLSGGRIYCRGAKGDVVALDVSTAEAR